MGQRPVKNEIWFTGYGGQFGVALQSQLKTPWIAWNRQELNLETLTQKVCFETLCKYNPPDFFIHAGAWTHVDLAESQPDRVYNINVRATEILAKWCQYHDVHLVFLSTDYVFDGLCPPYSVGAATSPLNVYGKSKALAEERIRALCPNHTIVRTSGLYSYTHHSFLRTIRKKLLEGCTLHVVEDEWAQPTFTPAFANLLTQHLDPPTRYQGRTLHLAGPQCLSWYQAACMIEASLGLKDRVRPQLQIDLDRAARRPRQASLLLEPSTDALPKLHQVLVEPRHGFEITTPI